MNEYFFSSVENMPTGRAAVAFISDSGSVFREQGEISPVSIDGRRKYIPWGADNMMPYDIMDLFDKDETMATCVQMNAEVFYGAGLKYDTSAVPENSKNRIEAEIENFFDDNDIPNYFLGICYDIKYFAFAVSVIILSKDRKKIVSVSRREACYCRFAPADESGNIPFVHYANWRNSGSPKVVETIDVLDVRAPLADLRMRMANKSCPGKFAVISRIPSVDSTYYPIPYYASLLKGKWYNIKQLIGVAKESKLKNSAPIKYQIEVSDRYWKNLFASENITDRKAQIARVIEEKQNMIDFLAGAENSGKVLFSSFYVSPDGKEQHDVKITKIDDSKEGGDWATDIQEAVNMICFTMRVHSNLVGSVPGKSQSNNSGSDKRELYTISQATQKPYRDLVFKVHRLIIAFNGWKPAVPACPFIQLSTLDEHRDAKKVDIE